MAKKYSNSEFEDILIYFTQSIFGQNTEEEIAWDLAKNCISKLGFEDCVIYFVDEFNDLLVQKAAFGPKNPRQFEIADPIFIPIGQGITGSAAKFARSELIADTSLDERYIVDDERRYSEITVPILVDGKVFGVIDCEHPEKNFFTSQHLKILEAIASIYSVKISKVRAERARREQEQRLLNIQKDLLSLKISALRTQLNPHFLFNAINSIQYFITIGDKRSALIYLTTFSKLIRYYLAHFEKDEVTISGELQLMKWYLELQKMRYVEKFEYELHVDLNEYERSMKIPSVVLGAFMESMLENSVFDNQEPVKAKITLRFFSGKLHLTATHISAKKEAQPRMVNYRENMTSWEEQIDLYNRLRDLEIEKKTETRTLENTDLHEEKVIIAIPTID